jgi:hypothetical protein
VRLALLLAIFLGASNLLAGCAHVKNDQAVCPEYRDIRCVGEARCSYDRGRGCKVCQCQEMDEDSPAAGSSPDDVSRPPESDH